MGRQKKPTHLRAIEGTLEGRAGRGRAAKRANEPVPLGYLCATNPPPQFCEMRQAIWAEAVRSAPKGLLRRLDERILLAWVNSVFIYEQAVEKLAQSSAVIKTPDGAVVPSPYIGIINTQGRMQQTLAAELGFTPASRRSVSLEGDSESEDPAERHFR